MSGSRPPSPSDADGATLAALGELVAIVARLRDPQGGCPWDLEQTHRSLIPYVLEEAHEVADAIRQGDPAQLQDELGDLLLQVVLHARIASEAGQFDLAAIARGISAKLVRRHPHVFAGAEAVDSAAVRRSWEAIKAQERAEQHGTAPATTASDITVPGTTAAAAVADDGPGRPTSAGSGPDNRDPEHHGSANSSPEHSDPTSIGAENNTRAAEPLSPLSDRLAAKARGLSALAGAMAISRQAAAAGFEWDDLDGVWAKVHEELEELKQAVALAWSEGGIPAGSPGCAPASGDSAARAHAETELGDVLYTLVNVGRWCRLDPEEGLAGTNRRFLDRFSRLEAALGGDLAGRSISELEQHWQQAKAAIRAEASQPNIEPP
jgi:XTP/dITP diphosphohydrolase